MQNSYEYKKCSVVAWVQFFRNSPGITDSPLSNNAPTRARTRVCMDGICSDVVMADCGSGMENTGVGIFYSDSLCRFLGVFSLVVYLGNWDVSNIVGVLVGALLAGDA